VFFICSREKLVDLRFQFLREILELRPQTGLEPLPRPHKFVTKWGQARSASPLSFRRHAYAPTYLVPVLPLLESIPGRHLLLTIVIASTVLPK
jgi:hypothetical protein